MRLLFVVCANGLGHFRRVVQVTEGVLAAAPGTAITVVCAAWQPEALRGWSSLRALQGRVRFVPCDALYPRWEAGRAYYENEALLAWHRVLAGLGWDGYDRVVSDNLVEVLFYRPDAVLMGSFFWHDVYARHFGGAPLVAAYRRQCEELLGRHRPEMIVNRYFAMPAVAEQTRARPVGLLPAAFEGGATKAADGVHGLLCMAGSNARTRAALEAVLGAEPGAGRPGVQLWMDRAGPPGGPVAAFDPDHDDFSRIDAVVARAGMGIVTDCLATATPLFTLEPDNAEMAHNEAVLCRLGLGQPFESVEQVAVFLDDPEALGAYHQAAAGLDRDGLAQTVGLLVGA